MRPTWPLALAILAAPAAPCPAEGPARFDRIVIDDDFPGGYQVEVADVNGDGKPDVIGVGGGTCAWYENPSWKKRVVTTPKQTPGIITSATADLDGDGKAEIAIGFEFSMNEPTKGKLVLAVQGPGPDDPWTLTPVMDRNPTRQFATGIGSTPVRLPDGTLAPREAGGFAASPVQLPPPLADVRSIHRLRWGYLPSPRIGPGSVSFEKKRALFLAPIFGPSARPPAFEQEAAHLSVFDVGDEPKSGRWSKVRVGEAPVLHAIDVVDLGDNGFSAVLGASNLGVTSYRLTTVIPADRFRSHILAPGAPGDAPKKGASEVHLGRLQDGRRFLATVEPWHGTDVAVYLTDSPPRFGPQDVFSRPPMLFGPRTVIDSTLKEGHALWVADVDGDGDDEVFAGYRGEGGGVLMFDRAGSDWARTVLDPAVAAQDLRGGDLDGDGTPDVVAIGGRTHNVVWYRPIRPAK